MSLADRDAKIRVPAHTRHAGMGVVEGVRAYRTAGGCPSIRVPADRTIGTGARPDHGKAAVGVFRYRVGQERTARALTTRI